VLIPVLDDRKHYWVDEAEVEKLLRQGAGWLGTHPKKEWIARRYFKYRRSLARLALDQLTVEDLDVAPLDEDSPTSAEAREVELEKRVSLNDLRLEKIASLVASLHAHTVVD
jgi:hypothetical protein